MITLDKFFEETCNLLMFFHTFFVLNIQIMPDPQIEPDKLLKLLNLFTNLDPINLT